MNNREGQEHRECEHCGALAWCVLSNDPYVAELYDEITEAIWWCDDCLGARYGDI
jgi:hypothetical protein